MNFKKPKKDVVNEVYYRVDNTLRNSLYNHAPYGMPIQGAVTDALIYAITCAITEAVTTVVENTYTDAEFEEDLGLTKKD